MTLSEFVRDVLAGSIAVMVGGLDRNDELLSGHGNPSSLTDEQIAAEAFARDVEGVSGDNFEATVAAVARLRKTG
jgi:hypothetical protein